MAEPTLTVDVSVVMACLDGLPHLTAQLDALAAQRFEGTWELVIADNGSTDATVAAARSYADALRLTIVDASDRPGQAHARNAGVAASRGQTLVFVDQDDVVGPGYLAAMHRDVVAHGFVAATVDAVTLNLPWAAEAWGARTDQGLLQWLHPCAPGAALAIDRGLWDRVGGFDEELSGPDDFDLCWRVRRDLGVPLRLCPDAVLRYRLRTTLRAFFRQGLAMGLAEPRLHSRWAEHGHARPPWSVVAKRWVRALALTVGGPTRAARAGGLGLLGACIGRLRASVAEHVLYL